MKNFEADIVIIGAGPVGLMCAYLANLHGLKTIVLDQSAQPLTVGRADALNARTLQLLEIVGLFDDLYPLGKPCNTSSIWKNGAFTSRQSKWWDELEGCFHKHFLMLGQAYVERLLDSRLTELNCGVWRSCKVDQVELHGEVCQTTTTDNRRIFSKYIIGSDGSRSLVRKQFRIPFHIVKPQMIWAVIDGVLETDFPKVDEIIVFQGETSDVAWIPREKNLDRFYVRMDTKDFTQEQAIAKIEKAVAPHHLYFSEIVWFSQFSVKESVADHYSVQNKVFLAGDACHVHSVNGGQGLNTGLADAFNLIWKIGMVEKRVAPEAILNSYEAERQPIAHQVIATSGELVRSTKFSSTGNHAEDYVKIVEKRAGNVTGMGIRYGEAGLTGQRLFDFRVEKANCENRVYSLLDYRKYTLLIIGKYLEEPTADESVHMIKILTSESGDQLWSKDCPYKDIAILVRPDGYIKSHGPHGKLDTLLKSIHDASS